MTDWYKMNPTDWNDGTTDLTLEQEGALLRICNAIHIAERPIRDNSFVVAGLLRCSDRKARRLILELVAAGKLVVEDGLISNRRAVDDVSTRRRLSVDRASTGSRGGVQSGKSRTKSLENNKTGEAVASTPNEAEEIREEESRAPHTPQREKRFANPSVVLQSVVDTMAAQSFVQHLEEKRRPLTSQSAEMLVETLREVRRLGGNPSEALRIAIRKGWLTVEIEYLRNAGMTFTSAAPSAAIDWKARLEVFNASGTWASSWGPAPGENGCQAPPELLRERAA